MWLFNRRPNQSSYWKTGALGFLSLALSTACSMPKPQEREQTGGGADSATFFVHKAEVSTTGTTLAKQLSLPVAKTFSFSVCVKDSQRSKEIRNHDFEITGSETTKVTSDANGCLIWSEEIKYNHLAPAQFVEVIRHIEARGMQQGSRKISFALNPWENDGHSLIEKKRSESMMVKAENALDALNAPSKQGIWIDDLRLTIDEKKVEDSGTVLNLEIRAQPSFAVVRSGGKKVLEPISQGKFKAEITLIQVYSENKNEIRKAIAKPVVVEGSIVNNSLLLEKEVSIASNARSGQIQLGLKVQSLEALENLPAFSGVFNVGEYDVIKGSHFARLKNRFQEAEGQQTVEQYLTEKSPAQSSEQEQGPKDEKNQAAQNDRVGSSKSQVRIKPLEFSNVGFKGQKTLNREKVFTVKACMVGPIDSKPIRGQVFKITKANGSLESLRTNDDGCLTWDDSIAFQLLENECWVSKTIQISHSGFSLNETLTLQINPWAIEAAGIRDSRNVGNQELSCAKGKAKIVLVRYDFERSEVDYPIDSYFNIKVRKKGIFKLQARLSRPSLTDPSGIEDSVLPPGKYRLRWAIVDNSVKDFNKAAGQIFQAQEKWVEIEAGGIISESLTLESSNFRALGNTNSILLEISPEKEIDSLATATFRGNIVMANNQEGSNLEFLQAGSDSLVHKLIQQFETDQKKYLELNQALSRKEQFAKNEGLSIVQLNDEKQSFDFRNSMAYPLRWQKNGDEYLHRTPALPTQELLNWTYYGKLSQQMAQRLCRFWFLDQMHRPRAELKNQALVPIEMHAQNLANLCVRQVGQNVASMFEVQYRYFMKDAIKLKDLKQETKDLTFAHAFALSHSHDEATSKTYSADVNGGFNTGKWFSPLSIGGGFRFQIAKSETDRQAEGNSVSIQSSENLMLEKLVYQMHAPGYEKCAIVRLNMDLLDKKKSPLRSSLNPRIKNEEIHQELRKGFLICEGFRNRPVNWNESYFVLNQKTYLTQVINPNANLGRPLFMAIRGEKDFRRFMTFINGRLSAPTNALSNMHNTQAEASALTPAFHEATPVYPGQYSADQ